MIGDWLPVTGCQLPAQRQSLDLTLRNSAFCIRISPFRLHPLRRSAAGTEAGQYNHRSSVIRRRSAIIGTVKDRILAAQYEALKAVNKELVGLYWDIGGMIYEKQQELGWGEQGVGVSVSVGVVSNWRKIYKMSFRDIEDFKSPIFGI